MRRNIKISIIILFSIFFVSLLLLWWALAASQVPTPVSTLAPTLTSAPTPAPPVDGYYSGNNISFRVQGKRITDFRFTFVNSLGDVCTITQLGPWNLDEYQNFEVKSNDGKTTVRGVISGKKGNGQYFGTCGVGIWSVINPE
jgi:hypothetical protein